MKSLGELYDTDSQRAHALTGACGLVMAAELRACEVDFTFAPCLDLDYGQSTVIGNRSFHRNPEGCFHSFHGFDLRHGRSRHG